VAATLYETGYFDYSEPNFVSSCSLLGYEDNPEYYNQWAIHNDSTNINLSPAWNITTGDSRIKVAVLDVGIDLNHADLQANLLEGYDAVLDDIATYATNGDIENSRDFHGTCCAGIIGAENNNVCVVGVAHTSKIISVRVVILRKLTQRILIRQEEHIGKNEFVQIGLLTVCFTHVMKIPLISSIVPLVLEAAVKLLKMQLKKLP